MAVIALTNRKGGVGKSSITANLAAELVARRLEVVVLDADPQGSLVSWAKLGDGLLSTITERIDTERADRFKAAVADAQKRADRVLIDTPPGFADPALMAALLADVVLLPCGPSPLDLTAARDAMDLARQARAQRGGTRPHIRFVPSKMTATSIGRDLPAALAELGEPVLPAIGQRVVVAEAAMYGLTVREYDEGSTAQLEFAALAKAVEGVIRK